MKWLTLVVLIFPSIALTAVTPPDKPLPFGKIAIVRGLVERRTVSAGEVKVEPIKAASSVLTQEVIATDIDGIITIETLSGDEITLFPSSRMMIRYASEGRYQLKLVYGKLKVKTRENFQIGQGDRLEIQTFNLALGPTGPSEFTIYRDLVERCRPENSPSCPAGEYYNEVSSLLKQNKLFSSLFVSKATSPLYVGLVSKQEWDTERFSRLTDTNRYDSIGERQWIIASDHKFQKDGEAKIVPPHAKREQ